MNSHKFEHREYSYGRVFFWAAFYNEQELIALFLNRIKINPFIKLYQGKNLLFGAVLGSQYDLLEKLIKDTKPND